LKAQIAANQKGIHLLRELVETYTLPIVHAYMYHVQRNAAEAVRNMLCHLSLKYGLDEVGTLSAHDFMDDGTMINLSVAIDRKERKCTFDFSGSGAQVEGNWNAPKAITMAAVIYCLRCLVDDEIPLNQGCLEPVSVIIPKHSILDPDDGYAVVGGNVMTSQRITDVIFRAFRSVAASQGCMNNLTFGNESFGMYETIGGGCGAGPSWNGTSGIQVHMTNTRITDVEILERRYPVIVREFGIRHGSGGSGMFTGGDGLVRSIEFRSPMVVSICSERRGRYLPFGMNGGGCGAAGKNLLTRNSRNHIGHGRKHESELDQENIAAVDIGGKSSVQVQAGDKITILTPGGGGWGIAQSGSAEDYGGR